MTRKYQNFISGTLSAGISNTDTSYSSAGLASLVAVSSPDVVYVVLDPAGVAGAPEVIQVVAHSASATTATVSRGQESTTARAHLISTSWMAVVTAADFARFDVIEAVDWVTTSRIAAGSVTAAKIGTAAITAAKIDVGAITPSNLFAAGVVDTAALANASVTATKILDGSVTTAKILDANVTTAKILDANVTTAKILDASVTRAKLAPNAGWQAGDLVVSARSAAGTGELLCDGLPHSRTTYADLFTAIGVFYGAGDGSTTFNVPDFQGRTIIGAGTGTGLTARTRGQTAGVETHPLVTGELASHAHTVSITSGGQSATHTHSVTAWQNGGGALFGGSPGYAADSNTFNTGNNSVDHTHLVSGSTANAGTGTAHQNMQPFGVANVFIKT